MKRYDSYKDSGVEWIGEIPSYWTNLKLGYVGKLKSGNGFSDRLQGREIGDYPFFKVSDTNNFGNDVFLRESNNYVNEEDYLIEKWFLFPKNTIVFPKIGMVLLMNKRRILNQPSFIDNNMMGFIPNRKLNYKYGYYYLTKVDLKDYCSDGTVPSIGESQINPIKIPLPPLSEQQQIVSFLDTKTSLIDSLIEKTQRKIELLKEKRTSLINEVVTKGLNPNVEMKDSGVEWIGEIPDNWCLKRMCYMFKPISVKNTSGEMNLSVYRDYGVIPTNSRDDNHNVISEDTSNYKLVNIGDFVMNKMKCWMGSLGLSNYRGIVSPSYTVMKPLNQSNRKYLHYLLRSQVYIPQYKKLSYGVRVGQWDMRFEDFRELPCLIPPLSEQQQIVSYLDEQTQLIDKTISIEEKRIELLKEYRQSLISEVVTGKRKVVE